MQKVQSIQPENHNVPKEKSLNEKQLIIGLKSEPLRKTPDDTNDIAKLIDSINTIINQSVDHSHESELNQHALTIRVSS